MLGPKVLIFPDSGPEFLRALRTAVFYSDQVLQAIPPLAPTKEVLDRIRGEAMAIKVDRSWRRPFAAVNFQLEAYNEIARLVEEKIIVPPNYNLSCTFTGEGIIRDLEHHERFMRAVALKGDPRGEAIWKAFDTCFPCFSDFLPMYAIVSPDHGEKFFGKSLYEYLIGHIIGDPDPLQIFSFASYLAQLNLMAEACGASIITLSKEAQSAVWAARALAADTGDNSDVPVDERAALAHRTAEVVLRRYVPSLERLPLEEVLEMRRKRGPEIQGFRIGLARLAAQIDVSKTAKEQTLQIADLVSKEVDPAVHELDMAVRASLYDAAKSIGQTSSSLISAAVPVALSYIAGMPIDWRTALAAVGGLVTGPALTAVIERKKLLDKSQWSVLFRMRKSQRKLSGKSQVEKQLRRLVGNRP